MKLLLAGAIAPYWLVVMAAKNAEMCDEFRSFRIVCVSLRSLTGAINSTSHRDVMFLLFSPATCAHIAR
jgi:hypothetical protein